MLARLLVKVSGNKLCSETCKCFTHGCSYRKFAITFKHGCHISGTMWSRTFSIYCVQHEWRSNWVSSRFQFEIQSSNCCWGWRLSRNRYLALSWSSIWTGRMEKDKNRTGAQTEDVWTQGWVYEYLNVIDIVNLLTLWLQCRTCNKQASER